MVLEELRKEVADPREKESFQMLMRTKYLAAALLLEADDR